LKRRRGKCFPDFKKLGDPTSLKPESSGPDARINKEG